jgi:hypothetical protein
MAASRSPEVAPKRGLHSPCRIHGVVKDAQDNEFLVSSPYRMNRLEKLVSGGTASARDPIQMNRPDNVSELGLSTRSGPVGVVGQQRDRSIQQPRVGEDLLRAKQSPGSGKDGAKIADSVSCEPAPHRR